VRSVCHGSTSPWRERLSNRVFRVERPPNDRLATIARAVASPKAFSEGAGRHGRVKLTKVGNLPNCHRGDAHAFSLTFRFGSTGPAQGSYVLRRPGFRATTLFIVPSDAGRRTYEAVIFRKP
jgi:hypothetical protein